MVDFGMTPQEFHDTLLEKTCHLRKLAHPAPSFTWSDVDALLHQIEPVEPFFRLFVDGPVPAETYTREVMESGLRRRRLIPDRFTRLMAGGATLVLNRMEVFSVKARCLCGEVERFAGYQTTANGYITFGGQGTFGKHWDVHDVFAFQLIGAKQWKVYPPTFPYPLSNHFSGQLGQQCPPTPAVDCQLETGDLLYIPRGWWHQVTPLDQPSFHLSVGLFVPTVFDYVMWVMSRALPQNPSARKGLLGRESPLGTSPLPRLQSLNDLAAVIQSATAAAMDPVYVAEFLKMISEQRRLTTEIDASLLANLAEKAKA